MNTKTPKVVITDWTFPDLSVEEALLREAGVEVVGRQCKSEAELIQLCADADAVITQFARVNANVINTMMRARVIVRYGIGVDNVDLAAARRRGIPVCNIPDYCVDEVADHALAFVLAATRQVVPNALHLREGSRTTKAQIGLWNLIQMPPGGDLLMPTFSRNEPRHIFSTVGVIPDDDLVVTEHLVRYRMRQRGEHKISLRAAPMTGRAGYLYCSGSQWSLVVRNFMVNPSGEYVDVPWTESGWLGFAVQACNVNSALGAFSEFEYHTPAIGHRTGSVRCDDTAQVWAFRGSRARIVKIARLLVAGRDSAL